MILIISTDLRFRSMVGAELIEKGYEVEGVEAIQDSLRVLARDKTSQLVLVEARGQDLSQSGLALLGEISRKSAVVVCAGPFDAGVDFQRAGVRHVISKPVTVGDIVSEVVRVAGLPGTY